MNRTRLLTLLLVSATVSLPMASQARSSGAAPAPEAAPAAPAQAGTQQSVGPLIVLPKGNFVAKNDGLCFTIRESKFTGKDLESSAPKPSGYSTCVGASALRMKNAVAVLVR